MKDGMDSGEARQIFTEDEWQLILDLSEIIQKRLIAQSYPYGELTIDCDKVVFKETQRGSSIGPFAPKMGE